MANLNIAVQIAAKDQGASGVIGGVTKALGGLGNIAGGAVSFALGGVLTQALGVVQGALGGAFSGALDAQAGLTSLTGGLDRLGAKAPITEAAALGLADQLKNLAGGSDDAIIAAESMLLRFDKIGKDTFPDVLKSSLDLAAALKVGPEQGAKVLGAALQDLSTDGTGALGRLKAAGVILTDQQEKQIKAMVAAGDVAGAQRLLLDALAKTTGGKAAEAATTLAGKWAIFKESLADAAEGVVLKFLPGLTQLADRVLPFVTDGVGGVADALGYLVNTLSGGGGISEVLTGLADFSWEDFLGPQVGGMVYGLIAALQGLVGFVQGNLPLIQATVQTVFGAAQQIFGSIAGFVTGTLLPAIASIWQQSGAQMPSVQAIFEQVMAAVQVAAQAAADFLTTYVIPALTNLVNWVVANWPQIQLTIQTVMAQIQVGIQTVLAAVQTFWATWGDEILGVVNFFVTQWQTIFAAFSAAFQGDWSKFGELLRVAWDNAWKAITTIAQTAIDWLKTQDWGKIGSDILQAIASGLANAGHWLVDAARTAAKAAFDAAMGFFGGGGGGGSSNGRAGGGAAYAGWPYWVGEFGPEPFIPAVDGRIVSHSEALSALSGASGGSAAGGRGGDTFIIYAQGATMTPAQFRAEVEQVLDARGERADSRIRSR